MSSSRWVSVHYTVEGFAAKPSLAPHWLLCADHQGGGCMICGTGLPFDLSRSERSCCRARTISHAVLLPMLAVPFGETENKAAAGALRSVYQQSGTREGHTQAGVLLSSSFVEGVASCFRQDPTQQELAAVSMYFTISIRRRQGGTPNPPLAGRSLRASRPDRLHSPL